MKDGTPGPLCLNLGCGNKILPNYLNLDIRKVNPQVLYCDVRNLWFVPDGSVAVIAAEDVFEHISPMYSEKVLEMWISKMKTGGLLYLKVPDLRNHINAYVRGEWDAEKFSRQLFGTWDYGDDVPGGLGHKACYDEDRIRNLLDRCGCTCTFVHLKTPTTYNMVITAKKRVGEE